MRKNIFISFLFCAIVIVAGTAAGGVAQKNIAKQGPGLDESLPGPTASFINFFESFESYTPGTQLVVQNPVDWQTWSGGSGTTEDPYVSSAQAYTGSKSVVIVQNNDLIKSFGVLTSGAWKISWQMYVPAGKSGYFNTMAGFAAGWEWAMQVFFNADGSGSVDAAGYGATTFSYTQGAWIPSVVICDLDNDLGRFILDGDTVHTWQWSLGIDGTGGSLQVEASDLYGYLSTNEMYHDNYEIAPEVCDDFSAFLTRCTNAGVVQARATLSMNIEHSGETVLFQIDETVYPAVIGDNGTSSRASISVGGLGSGDHTVSVIDPAECFDPIVVTCPTLGKADAEWEADDARWAAEARPEIPAATKLLGNYPNPFNPTTSISYQLSADGWVTLKIYNTLGEEVATLVNEFQAAGTKSAVWNGRNDVGNQVASGIYIYRLSTGDVVTSEKMMFVK